MDPDLALVLGFFLVTLSMTYAFIFVFGALLVAAVYRYKTATETAVEAMAKLAQDITGPIGKLIARFRLHLNS
jgi:type IV secretory pathway VirB2 component (pilin)